jgi:hypothetical protein
MVPELTHEQLVDTFGESGVLRYPESEIPEGITHPPSQRFLRDIGVPRELRNGFLSLEGTYSGGRLEPLPRAHARHHESGTWAWDLPEGSDHWYVLGGFIGAYIAIDGETGRIWFMEDGGGPPEPLHSGLDALTIYMYAIERDRHLYSYERARSIEDDPDNPDDQLDVYEKAAQSLIAELRDVDPTPFTDEEDAGPWTQAFDDIAGGQWG